MAYYPKRRTTFRRTAPRSSRFAPVRRMPYAGAKRRTMAPTRSFGAAVKKANLAQAQSKNVSACFMNHALHHNKWYKGKTTTGTGDAAVTSYKFQNMFADITHGTDDHQRVGDEIFLERLSLRMFLLSQKQHACVTYRIIVYYTPNGVIGSSGDPTLLSDGIDSSVGFNNLLRSVDKRGAHVIFEKLIVPGKNGIQGNGTEAISQIEEININLKRNVHFQTTANTYGAKGAWTNLHVAVLAYDGSNVLIPVSDASDV